MSDEDIVSLQSSMQYLPTWQPIIILQGVAEQLPPVREVMVGAVCRQKKYDLVLGIFMTKRIKCFLGFLCYLSFSVVSDFEDDFLYL
jgi:hypothetical protein